MRSHSETFTRSSIVKGAAFVRISRSSCSRGLPLHLRLVTKTLDHLVIEDADKHLTHNQNSSLSKLTAQMSDKCKVGTRAR